MVPTLEVGTRKSMFVSPRLIMVMVVGPFSFDPNLSCNAGSWRMASCRLVTARGHQNVRFCFSFCLSVPEVQIPDRNLPHVFKRRISQRPKPFLVSSSAAKGSLITLSTLLPFRAPHGPVTSGGDSWVGTRRHWPLG